MFKSLLLLHQNCTASIIKQVKTHLKIGILITFHYHTILCHCQKVQPPSDTETVTTMAEHVTHSSIFTGREDRFNAIHIKSKDNFCDMKNVTAKLNESLKEWKSRRNSAAWFYVALDHSDWIPILAKNGFRFHHAAQDGGEVAMVRWLAESESRIPKFAHTTIGAGAVVVNEEGRLLVVQERYQNKPYWKLPGGYVEPGEDIPEAAMREVMEETNITTQFKSMVAFRHSHGALWGCSDIYFIVELTPLSTNIKRCNREIEDSQWMEIDTYLNHPNVHVNNRLFLRKFLFNREIGTEINGTKTIHPVTKNPQILYALELKHDT